VNLQIIKKSVPFYWGNKLFAQKIDFLQNANENYDCFFVGSSLTSRHVIPKIINRDTKLTSYNLGTGSQFKLETSYLIDHLINSYDFIDKEDLIILDRGVRRIKDIDDVNLHTIRSKYYLDLKRLKIGLAYYIKQKNFNQIYNHILSYFENQLCIGELIKISEIHFKGFGNLSKFEVDQLGFYSMGQHQKVLNSQRLKSLNEKFKAAVKEGKHNNRKLKEIKIIEYEFNLNHKKTYINYGNPITNNTLYFDKTHYTLKGAEKYTSLLVKELNNNFD